MKKDYDELHEKVKNRVYIFSEVLKEIDEARKELKEIKEEFKKIDIEKTKIFKRVNDRTVWNQEKFAIVAATYKIELEKLKKQLLDCQQGSAMDLFADDDETDDTSGHNDLEPKEEELLDLKHLPNNNKSRYNNQPR